MLVNLSKPVTDDGTKGGRLETPCRTSRTPLRVSEGERLDESEWGNLPTFVLYTLRRRITSSAKKKRDPSKANLAQTPDGSFLDLLKNASDLLDRCGVKHPAPEGGTVEQYLADGPGFIFCANPAIGPLWDVTEQKFAAAPSPIAPRFAWRWRRCSGRTSPSPARCWWRRRRPWVPTRARR